MDRVSEDPLLQDITDEAELRSRLALFSCLLTHKDNDVNPIADFEAIPEVAEYFQTTTCPKAREAVEGFMQQRIYSKAGKSGKSVFTQLTFSGECLTHVFEPNRFKKDMSTEGVKIQKHYRYAIKEEAHVVQALEYACDKVPSLIKLPEDSPEDATTTGSGSNDSCNDIYLGGFKCVSNLDFLRKNNVKGIVNCAGHALGEFFVRYPDLVKAAEGAGMEVLHLPWVDSEDQTLDCESLTEALLFMEKYLGWAGGSIGGGSSSISPSSVLVHCAQGRSRSSALVICYLMLTKASRKGDQSGDSDDLLSVDEAFAVVKSSRDMAQPNANFMRQLHDLGRNGFFESFRERLKGLYAK